MTVPLLVIAGDQLAKRAALAVGTTSWNQPGLNKGLSLGIGSTATIVTLSSAVAGICALAIAVAWVARRHRSKAWLVALAVGGAASNSIDRVAHGGVIDFVPVGPIVLNPADVAVVLGVLALIWAVSVRPDRRFDDLDREEVKT